MRLTIAVVGASGFIGGQCAEALSGTHEVRGVSAPRLAIETASAGALQEMAEGLDWEGFARGALSGCDVVVNAAGLATATSGDLDALLGANSVLPLFLAHATRAAGAQRFVHISSAAVQGRRILDESETLAPENIYALSKALGEVLLRGFQDLEVVRYRPTSVHGPTRNVTRTLMHVAESPMVAVASPGDDPTPQIPVDSVSRAIQALTDVTVNPPGIVMHPWEGQTTWSFLKQLGDREPRRVPRTLSKAAVGAVMAGLPRQGGYRAHARRLELLLLGQRQRQSWLEGRIPAPSPSWVTDCRAGLLADRLPSGTA